MNFHIYIHIIGASAAHSTLVVKTENCLYVYMVHAHSVHTFYPVYVQCNISTRTLPLVYEATLAQETRLAEQKG